MLQSAKVVQTNNFAFKLANVNGTGSASANGLIMQAIFRMGIPVSGKNLFPSNIQGLPTWYEVRVNKDGHTARTPDFDLMVAMNAETYAMDVSRGRLRRLRALRLELAARPRRSCATTSRSSACRWPRCAPRRSRESRERILMKNIVYVGVLVALLSIDMEVVEQILEEKFKGKPALMESNHRAIKLGYDYAIDHLECPLPLRLEKMDATKDSILIDGNTATALGCALRRRDRGGLVPHHAGDLGDGRLQGALRASTGRDPETRKNRYCIVQAEDELAAVGVVIGAGWNGARAFTSTAGPGISLMNELIGLAYYAEIPAVIVDVQRTGPSTGMPTRTQQGDILAVRVRLARRHQAHPALSGQSRRVLLLRGEGVRSGRALPDAGVHAVRPRHRHERLGVLAPQVGRRVPSRPGRGALGRADRDDATNSTATRRWTRTAWRRARCPACTPRGRFSPAARGTTSSAATPRSPTSTKRSWTGSRESTSRGRRPCRRPSIRTSPGAKLGVISLGGCDGAVREAVDVLREPGHRRRLHAHPRHSPSTSRSKRSSTRTRRTSSSSRTATRSSRPCSSPKRR